ncbi:zinc ABC transporter substrate-binding protein [Domibacillus indicus]|uniref:metal ABC transporter solute-binding protein, Zn/Mn family n=1 Tax=Domibacillus indicus TaxID=1437523 RepID=UPI00203E3B9D|nr:zinc ABC transporter substrate-binding protein [Domibacillus indicus]MCM3791451.1 zinc ABC transporter substrate-binding protein [Domibacillus indicus]
MDTIKEFSRKRRMKVEGLSVFFTTILASAMFLSGCGESKTTEQTENQEEKDQLTIYTTIFPLKDFAEKIGGEYAKVESVYPPNIDAHTFEPSQKTMINIAESDGFIYTGAGLEGFVNNAVEALENEEVKLIEAADGVTFIQGSDEHAGENSEESEHEAEQAEETHEAGQDNSEAVHEHEADEEEQGHGDLDPHIWLDPIRAITIAENIKQALVELKPEQKEVFEENFEELKSELEQLDKEFSEIIQNGKTKEIVVSHAAYGYWGERYGLKQISIAGFAPSDEPSQKELQAIIKDAREKKVKYIIFEQNVESKITDVVQNEIGAEPLTLHNLESITEQEVENQEDYVSLMKQNIDTLKKALN